MRQLLFWINMVGNNTVLKAQRNLIFWKLLLVICIGFAIIPLFVLLIGVKDFNVAVFSLVMEHVVVSYFLHTVVLVLSVEVGAMLLGCVIAWLCAMYKFPLRRVIIYMQILPLLVPTYVSGVVWKQALSPHGFMVKLFGIQVHLLPNMMLLIGILIFNLYPYVFFVSYILFINMPQSIMDTARGLNRKHRTLLWWVGLPFVKTGLMGAGLLVLMDILNGYWLYPYFGVETMTTGIIRIWRLYGSFGVARALTAIMVVFVVLVAICKHKFEKNERNHLSFRGLRVISRKVDGIYGYGMMLICIFPIIFSFLIPLIQLSVWTSLAVMNDKVSWDVLIYLRNSLLIAFLVIGIQIPVVVLLSYAVRLCRGIFFKRCFSFLSLGYAIPSALVALVFIAVFKKIQSLFPSLPVFTVLINGSIIAMLLAYTFRYLPIALVSINNGFHKANIRYEQMARSLGSSVWRTLIKICVPLNKRYIITATMITIIDIIRDMPISNLLHPINFTTLAFKMSVLVDHNEILSASVMALLLVLAGVCLTLPIYVGLIKGGEQD